ncbi:MAG TPA: fatty acid desaturase [Cyclobacteriaceae bacterium]|nr:fatty acid desaturase [Cyclobacteriaceae bacterium]
MAFIDRILHVPSYGWADQQGKLIVPTLKQLWGEAFSRMNILKSRRNWIPFINWLLTLCMLPFAYLFLTQYFSWQLLLATIVYGMVVMSTHGTIWYHRYSTHRSYSFSNPIWRFITQNLVIRTFPEEVYVISHHVHHLKSDKPGDPYNSHAGIMYCMLSDVNHQAIAKDLSEAEYKKLTTFVNHTGTWLNTYKQYLKWGSIVSPYYAIGMWMLNWAFWIGVFFLIGGPGLVCALFTGTLFWYVFVRAFNYTGHGGGKVKHVEGVDFDTTNLSINQTRPGLFSGEWHNNHHLYPESARAGFLPYQLDLAWVYIWCLSRIGGVSRYKDSKQEFLARFGLTTAKVTADTPSEAHPVEPVLHD